MATLVDRSTTGSGTAASAARRRPAAITWLLLAAESAVACAALGLLLLSAGHDVMEAAFVAPVLYLASFAARRLLLAAGLPPRARATATALLGTVAVLLALARTLHSALPLGSAAWAVALLDELARLSTAFPFRLVLLLAAGFIWWRGALLASRPPAFPATAASFQLGAALLLAVHALAAIKAVAVPRAIPLTVAFFFCGLLAVALAHRQTVAGRSDGDGASRGLLAGSVALVLAGGLIVGFFFDAAAIRLLLAVLTAAGAVAGAILHLFGQLLWSGPPAPPPAAAPLPLPLAARDDVFPLTLPEEVRLAGRLVWGLGVLALFFVAAYRLLGDVLLRLFRHATTPGAVAVEGISGGWWRDLRSIARALRRAIEEVRWRLYRFRGRPVAAPSPHTAAVREAYRGLLYWAAKRGLARAGQETPYEYLRRLRAALPGGEADLGALTESYVRARYGLDQLGEEERRGAENSGRRLLRRLRTL